MRILSAVAALLLCVSGANAEVVFIRAGQSEGQGWLFRHETSCWVATAGHVVSGASSAIVVGDAGQQGQVNLIHRASDADFALLRVDGRLAEKCSASGLGDRDATPVLRSITRDRKQIHILRRNGSAQNGTGASFGTEFIEAELLGISEAAPTITLRPKAGSVDSLAQTDSGSPVLLAGSGTGEAGLPIALVFAVQNSQGQQVIDAVRLDRVRQELAIVAKTAAAQAKQAEKKDDKRSRKEREAEEKAKKAFQPKVVDFGGRTPNSDCQASNVIEPSRHSCGWQAQSDGPKAPPYLVIDLSLYVPAIQSVKIIYKGARDFAGFSVVNLAEYPDKSGKYAHFCRADGSTDSLACTMAPQGGRYLKFVLHAQEIELVDVIVDGPRTIWPTPAVKK